MPYKYLNLKGRQKELSYDNYKKKIIETRKTQVSPQTLQL